jgi:hypothetical protein
MEQTMDTIDARAMLERLVIERGEDYAGLSRLIGRNASYVQQFIKRGVPRRLAEADRHALARYFDIPESDLGGPVQALPPATGVAPATPVRDALIAIPRLAIAASAGPGEAIGLEFAEATYAFDRRTLRALTGGRTERLSVIGVRGDSMSPTFHDGDDILVDGTPEGCRLRDGVYVLRIAGDLVVKRVAITPDGFEILSDNRDYPRWPACRPEDVNVIGRVVWAARRVP